MVIENSLKRLFIIGNLYFLVYAFLTVYFFKERIFLDGTYYLFYVVQQQAFHIEHQRFILAISQLLALTGVKLHLPLQAILILNSLNPVVFLWTLFLLSIFWLKSSAITWSLLLSSVCGIYFIWFIPMYEVWYGCVLLIFFAGILERKFYATRAQRFFFTLLLITLLFSYPLIFIGVIYFSAAHFFRERKISTRIALIYLFCFVIWILWKFLFISGYESGKIEYPLSQIGNTIHQNFGSVKSLGEFLGFLIMVYPEEIIFFIATVIYFLMKKEKLQAGFLLSFVLVFLLLINLTQEQPWQHTNYFERMYLLLIPLCFVPFLQNIFSGMRRKVLFELLFIVIILFRLSEIVQHSEKYSGHIKELETVIEKTSGNPDSKFTVDFAKHPELSSLDEWSLPMESLIFSSLKNPKRSVTISWKADVENPDAAKELSEKKFRLRLDEIRDDDWLNQKYFHLNHGMYNELNW